MNPIIERVTNAVEHLTSPKNKYTDIVYVLCGLRESYQVTQKEMAVILKVTQSMISKFETLSADASLDFLISYAFALGYKTVVEKTTNGDEITRFNERQSKITEEISLYDAKRVDEVYRSLLSQHSDTPKLILEESKKHIIKTLLDAKDFFNYTKIFSGYTSAQENRWNQNYQDNNHDMLTSKRLSKMIGVSKKTIQRFNGCKASLPSIFKYAYILNMELRLKPILVSPAESLGDFYIRNCTALHLSVYRQDNQM